jgi:hypothetical protein
MLILMTMMMVVSFIPEQFREFFGDWKCDGMFGHTENAQWVIEKGSCWAIGNIEHNPTWHWGFRHWLLMATGAVFAVASLIRIFDEWERRKP